MKKPHTAWVPLEVLPPWETKVNSTKFLRYYAWLKRTPSTALVRTSADGALFPGVLPYPEVLEAEGRAFSGVPQAAIWAKSFLNSWVGWSNFVVLGCPECRGSSMEPQSIYQRPEVMRAYADRLLGEVEEFMEEVCIGALSMEGGRRSIEEALDLLQTSHASYGAPDAALGNIAEKVSTAIPVVAERVAVPKKAGLVNPADWLPPDRRAVFEDLPSLRRPELQWRSVVAACHRVSQAEEARLVERLMKSDMVTLLPESVFPRDSRGRLMLGGFFCVGKNEKEDRLIFDRRPENATMERLRWAKLPAGACFCRVLLEPHEFLRGSGDDLRNYYYTLQLPSNWIRYNGVGRRVAPELVAKFGGDPSIPHRMALRVLGMGDTNACDIAQGMHEHLLQSVGLLSKETKLIYGQHVPRGPLLEGVYLDDLLVVAKVACAHQVPIDGTFVPPLAQATDVDVDHCARAERAYAAAGLERAVHKSFRCATSFKAWGAEVDGVTGRVGAPKSVRQQVWTLLWRVILGGATTKGVLQRLMGYICFAYQYRRECFALQHHIYQYIEKMSEDSVCKLPAYICDELRSICLHLPFCFWNMRRRVSSRLLATDATPTAGGATVANVPPALAQELWRHSDVRGEAVRLDSGEACSSAAEEPRQPSVFASSVATVVQWEVQSSYSFKQTSHINLQEARALKKEIVAIASDPKAAGTIQICLNDSRVVIGAASKGRSSSFKLNGILRTMLPFLIFGDISLALLWVETSCNPADHPSRFVPLPPPRSPVSWMQKFGLFGERFPGLEVFAGTARLTQTCLQMCIAMYTAVDILFGIDAFEPWIEKLLEAGRVGFIWLAPPCGSFSGLRNLDRGGPLRPAGCPQGDERNAEVRLGNRLWRRALKLACLAHKHGIPFFLEHPSGSKAWLLKETQKVMCLAGAKLYRVHWCAYEDEIRPGNPNPKPTKILGTGVWLGEVARLCPGEHEHGKPLRGVRAKLAGAYPLGFCREFAEAYIARYGPFARRRALEVLPTELA